MNLIDNSTISQCEEHINSKTTDIFLIYEIFIELKKNYVENVGRYAADGQVEAKLSLKASMKIEF